MGGESKNIKSKDNQICQEIEKHGDECTDNQVNRDGTKDHYRHREVTN